MHLAIDATNRDELENASLWSTARPQARRTQAEEAAILGLQPVAAAEALLRRQALCVAARFLGPPLSFRKCPALFLGTSGNNIGTGP